METKEQILKEIGKIYSYPRTLLAADQILEEIRKSGYTPKTSMKDIVVNLLASFGPKLEGGEFGDEFTVEGCLKYAFACGGWEHFDFAFQFVFVIV